MAKVTEESLMQNLDFDCAQCGTGCTKINASEPEFGYVSRVQGHEGEFIGPICKDCFNKHSEEDRAIKKMAETAFLIVVKPDGEGAYMMVDGVSIPYLREPTFNDVITACGQVIRDVEDALFVNKLIPRLMMGMQSFQQTPKIVVPR